MSMPRYWQCFYTYKLMFNSETNCLIVFTCLLMILIVIRVTLVLWVFLYGPTVWLLNIYKITVNNTLNGVSQLLAHHPTKRKVIIWLPIRAHSWKDSVSGGRAYERQLIVASLSHWCFYPFLSPSLPLSLKYRKKIFKNNC